MASLYAPGAAVSADELVDLEEILEEELPAYLEDLAALVNVDCGSYTKAGVDQVGRWTARFLERLGATVEIRPDETLGDTVVGHVRRPARRSAGAAHRPPRHGLPGGHRPRPAVPDRGRASPAGPASPT